MARYRVMADWKNTLDRDHPVYSKPNVYFTPPLFWFISCLYLIVLVVLTVVVVDVTKVVMMRSSGWNEGSTRETSKGLPPGGGEAATSTPSSGTVVWNK